MLKSLKMFVNEQILNQWTRIQCEKRKKEKKSSIGTSPLHCISYSRTFTNFFERFRPVEIDYDTDDSGLFRAKGSSEDARGAKVILDSTVTKINTPLDLMATQTIDEEQLGNRVTAFRLN